MYRLEICNKLEIEFPLEKSFYPPDNLIIVTIQKGHHRYFVSDSSYQNIIEDFRERLTVYHETWRVNQSQKYVAVFPLTEYEWLTEQIQVITEAHDSREYKLSLLLSYFDMELDMIYFHNNRPEFVVKHFMDYEVGDRVMKLLKKVPRIHPTLNFFRNIILPEHE